MKKRFHTTLLLSFCLLICSCSEGYYIKIADKYIGIGEYERAIRYLDKAIAKAPDSYDAYLNKGICVLELGNEVEAIDYFTQAASILPRDPFSYCNRAESYMRLERYEEALGDYNKALKLLEGDPEEFLSVIQVPNDFFPVATIDPYRVHADRAVAYYFLGKTKLAFIDLSFCIDNAKELAQCYYWRGHIYLDNDMNEKGCDDLRKAIALGCEGADVSYRGRCECDNEKERL